MDYDPHYKLQNHFFNIYINFQRQKANFKGLIMKKIVTVLFLSITMSAAVQAAETIPPQSVLEQAFECKNINYKQFDAALKINKIPTDATPVALPSPVKVFGLSINKISVFREGGEDSYVSYVPGKSIKEAASAANIKLVNKVYEKRIKNRTLSVDTDGTDTFIKCAVNFE